MKLLEAWQIRAALKYAGGPHDDQYMEWLTRALNYFNLSNNNLRCRWSHGTNWSGEYESELETECLRLGEREVAESANPIIRACRESGSAVPPGASPVLQRSRGSVGRQRVGRGHGRRMQFNSIDPRKCSATFG
jgi:hypothetical protein